MGAQNGTTLDLIDKTNSGRTLTMALLYLAGIIFCGIVVYVVSNMVSISRNRMKLKI